MRGKNIPEKCKTLENAFLDACGSLIEDLPSLRPPLSPIKMSESNTLKNQFLKAEALVNEGRVQVPESLKYKLYGIGKQIVNGDCKMQQPPA